MTLKRIVFICMCVLLAIALILTVVVVVKVSPILSALTGGQNQPPATTTPGTTTSQTATTPPSTTTAQPPTTTTQPPITTEPGHVHNFQLTVVVQVTCDSAGYTVYTCECGKTDVQDYVDALGHDYGVGERVVFCDQAGYTKYICRTCGHEDRRNPTEPLGHDFEKDELKSKTPSCTQDGYDILVCQRCLAEEKANEVKAPGHVWSDWAQTQAPGPGTAGQEERSCAACQEKETRPCQLGITAGEEPVVMSDRHIYIVYVGSATTTDALRYEITDYSKTADMRFAYSEEGLKVTYTDAAGGQQTVLLDPLTNGTLVLDSDGNVFNGEDTPGGSTGTTEPEGSTGTTNPTGDGT